MERHAARGPPDRHRLIHDQAQPSSHWQRLSLAADLVTTRWWTAAITNEGGPAGAWTSVRVALAATAIALNSLFTGFLGGLTFFTLVVGHATFFIVGVFNNATARLRRVAGNVEEASMDLGATRATTWRLVTFPALRGAPVRRWVAGVRVVFR